MIESIHNQVLAGDLTISGDCGRLSSGKRSQFGQETQLKSQKRKSPLIDLNCLVWGAQMQWPNASERRGARASSGLFESMQTSFLNLKPGE